MSEALVKIGQIKSLEEAERYRKALAGPKSLSVMIFMAMVCGLAGGILGGAAGGAISSGFVCGSGAVTAFIAWVASLSIRSTERKECTETLKNSVLKFAWCLDNAIRCFNERVRAWNHLVEGRELGCASLDNDGDDLGRIHDLLERSAGLLNRGVRIYNWAKESDAIANLSSEPKLTSYITELLEAERELHAYTSSLNSNGQILPEQLLQNESAFMELEIELRGLLPAKVG